MKNAWIVTAKNGRREILPSQETAQAFLAADRLDGFKTTGARIDEYVPKAQLDALVEALDAERGVFAVMKQEMQRRLDEMQRRCEEK